MVYTVTFNPSLDYVVELDKFQTGRLNRTKTEKIYPGGKGINVSIVLKNLGIESMVLGFISGFTGNAVEELVTEYGCDCDFIKTKNGLSRINVKIKADEESEINAQGPVIPNTAIDELFAKLSALKDGDTLILAGSIPGTLPENIYEEILQSLSDRNIRIIVDATKDLLLNVLKYHPFLIKPNNYELGEMFKADIKTYEDIIFYAKKLQELGAVNVLVSMAGEGASLITEHGKVYKSLPPKGKLINSVGAGDSMVAGFLAGYIRTNDYEKAFKMGLAAGSATAFSEWLAEKEQILELYKIL